MIAGRVRGGAQDEAAGEGVIGELGDVRAAGSDDHGEVEASAEAGGGDAVGVEVVGVYGVEAMAFGDQVGQSAGGGSV